MSLRFRILASLVLSFSSFGAFAQVDTGSIVGTVSDAQQQRLAGATIHLIEPATGAERSVTSTADGSFSLSPLHIGTYTLTIERAGFERYVKTGLLLTAQTTLREEIALRIGSVDQTVEVTAGAPLLDTENSSLQHLVDQHAINDLPLNGRNVAFLAQTSAGVTIAQADSRGLAASGSFSANGARRGQNDYLLDGIDNNAAIMDYVNQSQYVILPPPDALQEFVVQTSNYSAEFGHAAGAVLNTLTKSGSDSFHGDAWEYFRNDALDARNYFATTGPKPTYHQNQFGFSASGPIVIPKVYDGRAKTFFFFDYQGTRITQDSSKISNVPTAAERNSGYTDLSDLVLQQSGTKTDALGRVFPVGTVFDPATTRATTLGVADPTTQLIAASTGYVRDPFYSGTLGGQTNFTSAGQKALLNQLPAGRLDANAIRLLNLYPVGNLAGVISNYSSSPTVTNNNNGFDVRLDQHFSQSDSAFARYSFLNTDQVNPGPFAGLADGQASRPGTGATQAQNVAASETHIFTASLANEARFGYSRVADIRRQNFANQLGIPEQYGIGGIPEFPGNGGLPNFTFGSLNNLGQTGSTPSNKASDITQVSDNLTYSHGHHVLRGGILWQNIYYPTSTPANARGAFGFSGIYTSVVNNTDSTTDRAQFLLKPTAATVNASLTNPYNNLGGSNSVSATSFPPISNLGRSYLGTYVQDDWHLLPKLTVNLGLRWEHYGAPTERDDRQANFLPGDADNPRIGAKFLIPQSQVANVPALFIAQLAKDGIAFQPTDNRALGSTQHLNFAPRFGVAYQAIPKLVVHAGVGLFFGGYENYGLSAMPAANFPFNISTSYTAANAVTPLKADNSVGTIENGLLNVPLAASGANLSNITLLGRAYDWKSAYTLSYNAQLEYQVERNTVLKLAYAGSGSRHLQSSIGTNTLNQVLAPTANAQTNSFFPDFARGGTYVTPSASTNYNGLQVEAIHHSRSLTAEVNYTYSKCLGDARDILDNNIGAYRAPWVTGAGLSADYTLCDIDVRNIFHASGTLALPFGRGHALLTHRVASAIAGGWSLQTIATVQGGQPLTVACTTTTSAGLGCNAFKVAGQSLHSGRAGATQFLNPNAFANPVSGVTGLAALGGPGAQVSGPAYRKLDLSLFRRIPLARETSLELRAEAFNLTNTANFSQPSNLAFTTPVTFGQITSTRDSSRQLQLAAKIYW